jgi:hypothetical protein
MQPAESLSSAATTHSWDQNYATTLTKHKPLQLERGTITSKGAHIANML